MRLSYSDTNLDGAIQTMGIASEIIEENNYYPFGLQHKGYNNVVSPNGNALAQQWKYNGKEYSEDLDLNTYDFGARNYDPALGRWMNIDPLAENSRRWTPYNFAYNNPIYFVDPDGMQAEKWLNKEGNQVYDADKGEYTKFAADQDKKFGDALKNSGERGEQRFNTLVSSDTEITVNFSSESVVNDLEGYKLGETTDINTSSDENGALITDSATITINLGTSEEFVSDIQSGGFNTENLNEIQTEDVYNILNNNLTPDDVSTATLGHEIDHVNPRNVAQARKEERNGGSSGRNNSEFTPQRTTNQILKDLAKKKL